MRLQHIQHSPILVVQGEKKKDYTLILYAEFQLLVHTIRWDSGSCFYPMSLKGRPHWAQPGCPGACVLIFLLLTTCQVTYTCALSDFGVLLCGGPRLLPIQGFGVLLQMAQSTIKEHEDPGLAWNILWGQEGQINLLRSGALNFRTRMKKGAIVAGNFRFESRSLWLLLLVLAWPCLCSLVLPNPSLA